ncbi:MAG: hypothetical protein KDE15_05550 [Erythrobacter sp.]|nr:hypothetical protein [Erythrobacter sp.]
MKYLLAAVSALAVAASPALAQGNGHGNSNGNGNGNRGAPASVSDNRGNGNGNGNRNAMRDDRGNGQGAASRADRQGGPPQARGNDDRGGPPEARGNGNGNGNGNRGGPAIGRGDDRPGNGNGNGNANGNRGNGNSAGNGRGNNGNQDRISVRSGGLVDFIAYRGPSHGMADGCPPGLARKYNGCRPPGLARQQDEARYRRYSPDWWGYGGLFGDRRGSYYYDDGFLLRLGSDGRISGYIPLLGGALAVGRTWPDDYRYARMPRYYESYYGLGGPDRYRYADNVVYRLDPQTTAIVSIAAMLTGDEFVVGQPMPRGYDVYNVPYGYRDRYYDGPDAMYRYNNGYVYQVDPETMLIASVIELAI